MDTTTMPPGPVRLFDVDPGNDPINVIVADPFRVVLSTDALAAAVYSAGAEAIRLDHRVWITSPDLVETRTVTWERLTGIHLW